MTLPTPLAAARAGHPRPACLRDDATTHSGRRTGMFGILGAPDVDWSIALQGGVVAVTPGQPVRAIISLRPRQSISARRVMAALVATEEYLFTQRDNAQTGSSTSRTWG